MGCDGGTIPTRGEVVKQKKKPETIDKDILMYAKWLYCALSTEELSTPIVACELGKLYNKEAVITFLLDRSKFAEHGLVAAGHIRSLRDIVTLNLTTNESAAGSQVESADKYMDRQASKYVCPISGLEMNGRYKFCFLRSCGCVLSEKALREIPSTTCHKCGKAYVEQDVVVINGNEESVERNRANMEARRALAKESKKDKGITRKSANAADTASVLAVGLSGKQLVQLETVILLAGADVLPPLCLPLQRSERQLSLSKGMLFNRRKSLQ
eukprot:Opistho-2@7365